MTLYLIALAFAWLPGMDLFVTVNEADQPRAVVAYDRDTRRAAWLDIQGQCYTTWGWDPTPNQGAITAILHVGGRDFALYHEMGHLRVERVPDSLWCQPLEHVKSH